MSARLRFGAQQQPCRIKSCFSASTEARGSSTATVTLEMFKRSAEIQMKLSLPCRGRQEKRWKRVSIVFFTFMHKKCFCSTISFFDDDAVTKTTKQTLLTSCIIKICSHYATSLMVSVRRILTTKWWHSCMGISSCCNDNNNHPNPKRFYFHTKHIHWHKGIRFLNLFYVLSKSIIWHIITLFSGKIESSVTQPTYRKILTSKWEIAEKTPHK